MAYQKKKLLGCSFPHFLVGRCYWYLITALKHRKSQFFVIRHHGTYNFMTHSRSGVWETWVRLLLSLNLKSHVLHSYWYEPEPNDATFLVWCSASLPLDLGFDVNGPKHICYRDNQRENSGCLATDEDRSKHQKWVMTEEESDDTINTGQH